MPLYQLGWEGLDPNSRRARRREREARRHERFTNSRAWWTPLHQACVANDLGQVRALLPGADEEKVILAPWAVEYPITLRMADYIRIRERPSMFPADLLEVMQAADADLASAPTKPDYQRWYKKTHGRKYQGAMLRDDGTMPFYFALRRNHDPRILKALMRAGAVLQDGGVRRTTALLQDPTWTLVDEIREAGGWEAYVHKHHTTVLGIVAKCAPDALPCAIVAEIAAYLGVDSELCEDAKRTAALPARPLAGASRSETAEPVTNPMEGFEVLSNWPADREARAARARELATRSDSDALSESETESD